MNIYIFTIDRTKIMALKRLTIAVVLNIDPNAYVTVVATVEIKNSVSRKMKNLEASVWKPRSRHD